MARAVPAIGEQGYGRVAFDEYRTPAWVVDVLIDNCPVVGGAVWEPAAGQGDMVSALRARDLRVFASDIRALPGLDCDPLDFTASLSLAGVRVLPAARCIITNPPFQFAEQFIRRALDATEDCRGVVAMLLGHDYDTALTTRGWMFSHPAFYAKVMLGRRITWVGFEDKASPRQIHAWYVWSWAKNPAARPVIIYPKIGRST